jgi:hypothetical protein
MAKCYGVQPSEVAKLTPGQLLAFLGESDGVSNASEAEAMRWMQKVGYNFNG